MRSRQRRPVIAIAGLACETSTFSPSKTLAPAFHPQRGPEVIDRYAFLHRDTPLGSAADWRGTLIGHALSADEIVTRLEELVASTQIDGLWFDIHGAMCVEGLVDVEAVLLRRIRAVVGAAVVVSASMDLHGNVSRDLAHQTDLVTCYRMAPHEDALDTKERACRNLVELLTEHPGGTNEDGSLVLPLKAWVPIPILLPGEQTSTRIEPAKHIYAAVPEVEARKGILDAAIWVGYAWADEPRNRAAIVVTGWDRKAVGDGAAKLAHLFWKSHADFVFVAPTGTYAQCLDAAVASKSRPFFISDSGDNPTAGGAGDVTWGLTHLLARPDFQDPSTGLPVIYASVPGPQAVRTAVAAGVGATVTVTAGAEVDDLHSGPVTLTGRVHAVKHGDKHARTEVVIQVGSVFAILTELRKPYHREADFTELALDPRHGAAVVVVKIGYPEPELYGMAADWMLALTPGGVDQDLERLGHHRIRRPMWPFDKVFETEPDLRPRFVPRSNEPMATEDE